MAELQHPGLLLQAPEGGGGVWGVGGGTIHPDSSLAHNTLVKTGSGGGGVSTVEKKGWMDSTDWGHRFQNGPSVRLATRAPEVPRRMRRCSALK